MNIDIIKQDSNQQRVDTNNFKIELHNDDNDQEEADQVMRNRKKLPEEHINKVISDQHNTQTNQTSTTNNKEDDKKMKQEQDNRNELKRLLKKVPKKKKEVFAFDLKWDIIVKHDLVETKMHPWLKKKSMELFGNEEKVFIELILKKLRNKENPDEVAKR